MSDDEDNILKPGEEDDDDEEEEEGEEDGASLLGDEDESMEVVDEEFDANRVEHEYGSSEDGADEGEEEDDPVPPRREQPGAACAAAAAPSRKRRKMWMASSSAEMEAEAREEATLKRLNARWESTRQQRSLQKQLKSMPQTSIVNSRSNSSAAFKARCVQMAAQTSEEEVAMAIFANQVTAPVRDDKHVVPSAFKRPRRTTCSDARQSYESVHESMLQRMDDAEQARYTAHMFGFFQDIEQYKSVMEARQRFFEYAEPFMTSEELKGFKHEAERRGCGSGGGDGGGVGGAGAEAGGKAGGGKSAGGMAPCAGCGAAGEAFVIDESRAEAACGVCGIVVPYAVTSEKYLPYGIDRPIAPCPYRRSSHFVELLNSLQGKHQGGVPEHVMERIHQELKKQRITDFSVLDRQRMRRIMKHSRLNEFYGYIEAILAKLQNRQPPVIPPEVEAELKQMFCKAQEAFDVVVKKVMPQRRNYMSYSLLLYRLFQLLERDEFLPHVQLLTTRSKLFEQDMLWREICAHLSWRFIPIA